MQEATNSYQALGESTSPTLPSESARSLDGPCVSSGKSKKRERPDHSVTAGKKVQLMEEYTSPQKRECTENLVDDGGGLASIAAVDQLVSRMKQEKYSFLQRSTAAKILVGTTKDECLKKFVLLGGVSILEEWIQEGSKGRSSDAAMKDGDKGLDEEMMVILQALERLPICLETLKGCSIGKSVKQLRNVGNGEIQKRARKLVDTWRKRVDLEMKQNNKPPTGVLEHAQHVDSMSSASDLSPGKAVEASNQVAVKLGSTHSQEVNATSGSPNDHVKTCISPEKDASKKTARLSASSITSASSLSPAKKQKHASLLSMDKDWKDEALNSLDCQKLKERDPKCENSSSHAGNDSADRKTNEYRKKLRSGGSSAAPCSTDSQAIMSPCSSAPTRVNSDEKVACVDGNVGDSEQQQVGLPNSCQEKERVGTRAGHEAPDPPGISERDAGSKDGSAIQLHPQDVKTDHVNESCLSSQSSCTDKRNITSPKGVFMVGQISSSTSPLQGDTKLYPASNVLSGQAIESSSGKEGMFRVATKSLSLDNNHLEPNTLSESMAKITNERNGSANLTHVGEVGVAKHEKNGQQVVAEFSSSHLAVDEVAGMLDGAACSESTKLAANTRQESENKTGNLAGTPLSAANGCNLGNNVREGVKAHMKTPEILAVTQSCHDFDLNEGLAMDDFIHDDQPSCGPPPSTSSLVTKVTGTLSAPIAVSAATTGAFIPPLNAPCKSDIGWKGSAATSAFRPAEPRNAPLKMQPNLASSVTEVRNVNSFDLNVAEQDAFEDCTSFSGQGLQEAHLDLNYGSKESEIRMLGSDLPVCSHGKFAEKRAVLDFDLNEELDGVRHEQEVLSTPAARSYEGPLSYGGLSGRATPVGDVSTWNVAEGTSYPGTTAVGPRIELFCSGPASQPAISSRQVTPIPPLPSVVYSHTAPFFGGSPQTPAFPASFTYNPMSVGPDTSFMVSKGMPDPSFMVSKGLPGASYPPSVGVRSRAETSVRPAFLTSIDDLRGPNNFYTWGRAPQNIYGNSGATIISYNDAAAAVGAREHVVNFEGTPSLEEQMRLFQQAAVPVSSLKGRDPEYFSGLKQTWH
ncbi:hypothetical protein GOP47_0024633 [Adiantum capillus-veneris]|uniref:TFIIS N-terminal domain-containing protein n=1 Tax=Adiantum capillus-veneris TaxID=13818 RepID=A0A9D4U398_ADICA|nr:hypothetical protein GOP47_0024633 [Adiantum capillus-veneris]